MMYPKFWNDYQEWIFTFTVSKATVNFIFAHKWFFQVRFNYQYSISYFVFYRIWLRTGAAKAILIF